MQPAGMLRATGAICLLLSLVSVIDNTHSLPLQLLPSIPGYIPVYIRYGDQPLEDINPALAEAFHEQSSQSKSIKLDEIPVRSDLNPEEDKASSFAGKPKKKNVYPVHVRETKNDDVKGEDDEPVEKISGETVENGENGKRKTPNPKSSVIKLKPRPDEEKKESEKPEAKPVKNESKKNELYDVNLSDVKILGEKLNDRPKSNTQNFFPILKIGSFTIDEVPSERPIYPIKDISNLSEDQETSTAAPEADEEVSVKEQRLPGVLSNIEKLTSIPQSDLTEKDDTESKKNSEEKDTTQNGDDM